MKSRCYGASYHQLEQLASFCFRWCYGLRNSSLLGGKGIIQDRNLKANFIGKIRLLEQQLAVNIGNGNQSKTNDCQPRAKDEPLVRRK